MTPLLLSKNQIAEIMGLTPDVARATLVERGINPVDFGPGRGRGLRWYAAAVQQVVSEMHMEAQTPKTKSSRSTIKKEHLITGRSFAEIKDLLTHTGAVQ